MKKQIIEIEEKIKRLRREQEQLLEDYKKCKVRESKQSNEQTIKSDSEER